MIKTIVDTVAPWLRPALIVGGLLLAAACVALWFKADAAEQRAIAATRALEESERTLTIVRAQHIASAAVAETLLEEREKDRKAARKDDREIRNAPIEQNNVVPGALPLAIDGLRRSSRPH